MSNQTHPSGFSPINTGVAFGILEPDAQKLLSTVVMHEIIHALGLKHFFSEKDKDDNLAKQGKKHIFKFKTANIYIYIFNYN